MPSDFQKNRQIIDDIMHDIMVKPLPCGVRLMAIFDDSCHSGIALDLPCIYLIQGKVKEANFLSEGSNAIKNASILRDYRYKNVNISYQQMLNSVRVILLTKYSQKPQLSTSHEMEMNSLFII
ncbi:caspase domain-containing protein [Rhizophagus irregularis DAOM 181602=DAOM 197198]|nr:caspase domain-containing protein [Rhizophagus irregularis DAOM 181602=DAOM 197198]